MSIMTETKRKRTRATNFTREETHRLIDLVEDHLIIVENKCTDSSSWREKDAEWAKIAEDFNANNPVIRSRDQLRLKYDCLKKATRDEIKKLYQSGGIPLKPSHPDDVLERVRALTQLVAAGGLPSSGDSHSNFSRHDNAGSSSDCDDAGPELEMPLHVTVDEGDHLLGVPHSADPCDSNPHNDQYNLAEKKFQIPTSVTNNSGANLCKTTANGSWDYCSVKRRNKEYIRNNGGKDQYNYKWVRRRVLPAWPDRYRDTSFMPDARRDLADLQADLLRKEHETKERRLNEHHAVIIKIREAELESIRLDIEMKKKQFNNIE